MSEEEKKDSRISRREFLKDAGLIVGGATVGSMALVNACGSTTTVTAPGATSTKTVTTTVTSTVAGPGGSVITVTATAPGATVTATKTVTPATPGGPTLPGHTLVSLKVNGEQYVMPVKPEWTLAFVIREKLKLFGTKIGCDRAQCGTCTVIANGKPIYACAVLACESENLDITTIEGLAQAGKLSKIQQNFLDTQTFQCGYCTPGMIMSATALLTKTPKPTLDQVREALSGNICFCGDSTRQVNVVMKGI